MGVGVCECDSQHPPTPPFICSRSAHFIMPTFLIFPPRLFLKRHMKSDLMGSIDGGLLLNTAGGKLMKNTIRFVCGVD